jgi:TPR repeat protein
MAKLQRQLALGPDLVPEPPTTDIEVLWPLALRLCAVAVVAAAVALLLISLTGARFFHTEAVTASAPAVRVVGDERKKDDPLHATAAVGLLVQRGLADAQVQPAPAAISPISVLPPLPDQPGPAVSQPVAEQPANSTVAPANSTGAPDSKTLPLDSDEITLLLKRGKDFLGTGDLAAARLLLRRAAEAGSAEAAFALGATFDPAVLQRLKVVGAAADVAQARKWYEKAAALGSTAASQQLEKLAQAAQ